MDKISLIYSYY